MVEVNAALPGVEPRTKAKNVAVIGFGNVGTGVIDILYRKKVPGLKLSKVVVQHTEKPRSVAIPASYLTTDVKLIINDPKIDIVVELMGGFEPAKGILLDALRNGKDIVTANKGLIAREGHQIFRLATDLGRCVGFRGALVGCYRLIYELSQAEATTKRIKRIYAILNGTCNYILSTMTREGKEFEQALREAQEKGYAERDPSEDIDGIDTAFKTRILLGLISNSYGPLSKDFAVEGIRNITADDIRYATELGYSIKLLGVIEQREEAFYVGVYPAMMPKTSLLGSIEGADNGIEIEDEYGIVSGLIAPGAGTYPTAEAIIQDLVDIATGRMLPTPDPQKTITLASTGDLKRRYYARFSVVDEPGTLAQICNIFWKYNISIAAIIQKEATSKEFVPLVMTTHLAKERDLQAAIEKVDNLDVVKAKTNIIRILGAQV